MFSKIIVTIRTNVLDPQWRQWFSKHISTTGWHHLLGNLADVLLLINWKTFKNKTKIKLHILHFEGRNGIATLKTANEN